MEQQCESGCECLRNGDVVTEDRISELHDDLLVHIISSLPTKSAVTTSVLSKRWRHVWKTVQNLKFESDEYHHTFIDAVYRFLKLHKAPFLESLHLEIREENYALVGDVGILVEIAFARHVRNLVLVIGPHGDNFNQERMVVRFPSLLCSYGNNTLETLELKNSICLHFPSRVCLNSLRKLHLYDVQCGDKESFCNLLCGCPLLEDLVIHTSYINNCGDWYYTIAVPSLQRLTITLVGYYFGLGHGGYMINAPSLKYLNIRGLSELEYCLIEKAPELVEAKLTDVSDIANENILESLTSAKRLSLHLSTLERDNYKKAQIKYPSGSIFHQLVYLELYTYEWKWWNLLSFMLDASPKLQILKLTDVDMSLNKGNRIRNKWNQPECVPECLLFHLETFVWIGYEWQRKDEREVATYILSNARQLKKATFSTKPIEPEKLNKLERRRKKLDELASVGRASSNSCNLVFESL